jgi:ABC-type multidrug transport system ATPase subunit
VLQPDTPGVLARVQHLSKHFRHTRALDDVSLSIWRGEVLGLIGPNGSGKTTLFECLGGVLPPDAGCVTTPDGRALSDAERTALLFYLPDAVAPWPAQTVCWALEFVVGYFGGRHELRGEVVRRLGLSSLLPVRMGELSKGQRKRALLALGLLAPQPVLLADEPFEGLDLRQTREMATTLRAFAATGRTLFLSIHQIGDAARVCDRFVLLSGGRVRGEGTLRELAALNPPRRAAAGTELEEVFLALT